MVCVAVLMGLFSTDDHGSVYTSQAFRDHCTQLGVRQFMGAVGTSADNVMSNDFLDSGLLTMWGWQFPLLSARR